MPFKRSLVLLAICTLCSSPALAQAFEPPPFPALEDQKTQMEQRRLDDLESRRVDEMFRTPTDPAATSQSALRRLEIEREMDRIRLEGALEREAIQRERTLEAARLPNRRIAASSVLVIDEPAKYNLPPPPAGRYYARLNGRFVVVDAVSELVVEVLDVRPADPVQDVPLPPTPAPSPAVPQAGQVAN